MWYIYWYAMQLYENINCSPVSVQVLCNQKVKRLHDTAITEYNGLIW